MSAADFNGTSLSPSHIGDRASKGLAAAYADKASENVLIAFGDTGDEAANVRTQSLTVTSLGGDPVTSPVRLFAKLYDADMVPVLVGAGTLTAATGTAVTTDARPAMQVDTEADGTLDLDVFDVTTALAGDLIVGVRPVGRMGGEQFFNVTFA
jgi:hypothetical protein